MERLIRETKKALKKPVVAAAVTSTVPVSPSTVPVVVAPSAVPVVPRRVAILLPASPLPIVKPTKTRVIKGPAVKVVPDDDDYDLVTPCPSPPPELYGSPEPLRDLKSPLSVEDRLVYFAPQLGVSPLQTREILPPDWSYATYATDSFSRQ